MDSARIYREKVIEHAGRRLPSTDSFDPVTAPQRLRRFLKIEGERLRMASRSGASGRWLSEARCFALDLVVQLTFRDSGLPSQDLPALKNAKNTMAVVAIGGYGRGELAPFSDLDLLFIHSGVRIPLVLEVMEGMLRVLWDSGLTIGHSFRTIKECVSASHSDLHLATSLTNTRLLAGSSSVYNNLTAALEKDRRRRGSNLINSILRERSERYAKFGDAVCLQEPNIKESAGGLRDLHSSFWIAYAKYGCKSVTELLDYKVISKEDLEICERSYDFLLRVRYHTHLLTGRKADRLSLDLQPALASEFGYTSDNHLEASEKFMRDYYKRSLSLYLISDGVIARCAERNKRTSRWVALHRSVSLSEIFSIEEGILQLDRDPSLFITNPLSMFEAFALAQAARVQFGHSLSEAIRNSLGAIDKEFRSSVKASDEFLKLLRRRGRVGHVLRLMHQVGFLERYLPEFRRVSMLIQHDLYHHYTIDEHTLRVVEALDELNNSEDVRRANLRSVFDEVEDPALLYLSLLLHDIGKGQGPGHVARGTLIAERICNRLQLSKDNADRVVSLVAHHITMSHISQRRDLTEPQVATEFAAKIKTLDQLNMLLLLTYSDMNGVGPGVWSEWKGHLLWELYECSRRHLVQPQSLTHGHSVLAESKENVLTSLGEHFTRSVVERHLALLPDRYLRTTSPETIGQHLRLIESVDTDGVNFYWRQHRKTVTELTICARDRHGLFADIAGTLTTQGVEVLRAEINTREDGIAIDVFILRIAATHHSVEERRWLKIERALRAAVAGEVDVAAMVEKWKVQHTARRRVKSGNTRHKKLAVVACDNKAAQAATVVEVRASDEVGLAYKIASVATALGLEISYAKITTEKSDAFDVFYVTDSNGMRLSEDAMQDLEDALMESISTKTDPTSASPRRLLRALLVEAPTT
jgi:[protein-PII] uridylyltransferase